MTTEGIPTMDALAKELEKNIDLLETMSITELLMIDNLMQEEIGKLTGNFVFKKESDNQKETYKLLTLSGVHLIIKDRIIQYYQGFTASSGNVRPRGDENET